MSIREGTKVRYQSYRKFQVSCLAYWKESWFQECGGMIAVIRSIEKLIDKNDLSRSLNEAALVLQRFP